MANRGECEKEVHELADDMCDFMVEFLLTRKVDTGNPVRDEDYNDGINSVIAKTERDLGRAYLAREESIGILSNLSSHGLDNCDYYEDDIIEALDFAIVYMGGKISWKGGV
jgi:hypothetical protein